MKRATGIGGVFFKAKNPKELAEWYQKHLGIALEGDYPISIFRWREHDNPDQTGATVWGVHPQDTTYFGEPGSSFMLNFRVDDLDALLATLKTEGVTIAGGPDDTELGRFAWVVDEEGNRVELWEAPKDY